MKVLHVMAGANVGGAETFFIDAIKAINEEGISQRVVTRSNNDNKISTINKLKIPLKTPCFNRFWKRPTTQALSKTIEEFEPDIVQHWMGRAGTFAQHGRHTNIGWYGGYYKPQRFDRCHHHVAVTQDIADHIIRQGVHAKRVHLLNIYAEFENAAPLNRQDYDTPDDVPLLLSLSRLHTKKGLDILIEAMQRIPDAYLWIAGDGPLKQDLKKQVEHLGLSERIKFLGWRYDREALLATADICVFPSRYEPFGAVVIEAWATGTPLVVTKAAGPKAYVNHEENGLLVEIDDVHGLALSINRLIGDKGLQHHLTENGLKTYEVGFTREVFKNNVIELYNHVKR